jgi:5-methylcytosine-specific restriction endonuclease McrA
VSKQRKPLSHRTRFAVLAAGDFRCTYCGRQAPEVVLHVDHVLPVALGGTDDPGNLAPACESCNAGKGASRAPRRDRCPAVHRGAPVGPVPYIGDVLAWWCSACGHIVATSRPL